MPPLVNGLMRSAYSVQRAAYSILVIANTYVQKVKAKIADMEIPMLADNIIAQSADINVDKCIERYLQIRERSHLPKRITQLKKILKDYNL